MDLAEIRKKARSKTTLKPGRGLENQETKKVLFPSGTGGAATAKEPKGAESPEAPVVLPAFARTAANPLAGFSGLNGAPAQTALDALEALFREPAAASDLTEGNDLRFLQKQDSEQTTDVRQLLTFSLGREDYALDINCIREIIKPREITDIPRVPDFIIGIISLRGIIISIFDLKKRLSLGKGEITPSSRIIVCQQGEKIIGFLVDGISQVIRITDESIEPPPSVLSGLDRDMVEGVGRYQGRMTILLRLPCIMDAELI